MLQLHLSYQQFYCLLRRDLYQRFYGMYIYFTFCMICLGISGYFTSWWHHQMKTFSELLAFCAGNSRSPVNSPRKGQWRGALMFSLICIWINSWVNNREAGDLRPYHFHYDVTTMMTKNMILFGSTLVFETEISMLYTWPTQGRVYEKNPIPLGASFIY